MYSILECSVSSATILNFPRENDPSNDPIFVIKKIQIQDMAGFAFCEHLDRPL